MPIAGGANELGELEDLNSSPDQNDHELEQDNQARMPKNSLFIMEG